MLVNQDKIIMQIHKCLVDDFEILVNCVFVANADMTAYNDW